MLDVKIGSAVCYLLYTLQKVPILGGKKFDSWYDTKKLIFNKSVDLATNLFWGYVGFKVSNEGLLGGTIGYLMSWGAKEAILKYKTAQQKKLQQAFASIIERFNENPEICYGHVTSSSSFSNKLDLFFVLSKTKDNLESIRYNIRFGKGSFRVKSSPRGFFPLNPREFNPRELLTFSNEQKTSMKNYLRKLDFIGALEYLEPILKSHSDLRSTETLKAFNREPVVFYFKDGTSYLRR